MRYRGLLTLLTVFISLLCTSHAAMADEVSAAQSGDTTMLEEFTPARLEKGKQMYKQLCLRCHGPEMNGGNNAFDLRTFPLEQRERFFNSVTNGKRQMPPWKGIISANEISLLWAYVGTRGGTIQR